MAISKRLRYEVLKRDGHRCRYCGATADEVKLVVDAVVPEALGGSHKDPANLVAACDPCNNGKTSSSPGAPLVANVADDALRWSRAMQVAAGEMLARASGVVDARAHFEEAWARYGSGPKRKPLPKDPGWEHTVDTLLSAGLPMGVLEECIEIAMSQRRVPAENVFRYMCGVAWRKVRELQDRAREITQEVQTGTGEIPLTADEHAEVLLGQLTDFERARAYQEEDDAREEENSASADGRASGALWSAFNSLIMARNHLAGALEAVLNAFPDGEGVTALDTARTELETRFGRDFDPHVAVANAGYELAQQVAARAAEVFFSQLPASERDAWLERAHKELEYMDFGFSDEFWLAEAARIAREALTAAEAI